MKKSKEAFRTISEVADLLDVQQHVLRFWETKFSQVKPLKRGGGRRYYRPEDVALLQRIHHLLYTEGYTIKGVQKLLKGQGKAQIIAEAQNQNTNQNVDQTQAAVQAPTSQQQEATQADSSKMTDKQRAVLEIMLTELKAMRAMLDA
ncbi:MAG: MerR family transcriptional regulator [Pseudomonadota bacterium]